MKSSPGSHVGPTPSKAEIELLEPFSGLTQESIVTPASKEQFAIALNEILDAGVVGFDTESKPIFASGVINTGPDIVQFATKNKAFIFQLQRSEGRPFLEEILRSEAVLKVGFDLKSDCVLLHRKLGLEVKAIIDLGTIFRKRGHRNTTGIKTAVGIVLQRCFRKSKSVTTSNWAISQLTQRQLEYAANDAYAALLVWIALGRPRSARTKASPFGKT